MRCSKPCRSRTSSVPLAKPTTVPEIGVPRCFTTRPAVAATTG